MESYSTVKNMIEYFETLGSQISARNKPVNPNSIIVEIETIPPIIRPPPTRRSRRPRRRPILPTINEVKKEDRLIFISLDSDSDSTTENVINLLDSSESSDSNDVMPLPPAVPPLPFISSSIVPSSTIKYPKCYTCKVTFNTVADLNKHFVDVHNCQSDSDNEEDAICRCIKCGGIFVNDNVFNAHTCSGNGYNEDNIPTDSDGEFACPMCTNIYSNEAFLGEHFITAHNNYEECCVLDDRKHKGFPGFDLLEIIGMIDTFHPSFISSCPESCSICFNQYEILDKEKVDNFWLINSDTEDYIRNNDLFNIERGYYSDGDKVPIYEPELLNICEVLEPLAKIPLKLNCCNQYVCYECMYESLYTTNSVVCLFCKTDHTQESDYIVEIEESDEINKDSWISWWRKHLDIFL